jgi:hypothetical protein
MWIVLLALLIPSGLAQSLPGMVPLSSYADLLALIPGFLIWLLPNVTVYLTEFWKTRLGLKGGVINFLNGCINAIGMGIISWGLAGYTGGVRAVGLWVLGSLAAYWIDQGYIARTAKNADNQAEALAAALKRPGGAA